MKDRNSSRIRAQGPARHHTDLVIVSATLRGVMNALALSMYARGLESDHRSQLVVIGNLAVRDRAPFGDAQFIPENQGRAAALLMASSAMNRLTA